MPASGRGRRWGGGLLVLFDHVTDAIADFGAHADPVIEARIIDCRLFDGTARIVRTDLLDETPVAGLFLVGDDDVIVGTLLGAGACQSNLDHGFLVSGGTSPTRKTPEASQSPPLRQAGAFGGFLAERPWVARTDGMRCFLAILGLALCLGCSRDRSGKKAAEEPVPDLRLVLVTDLKGYLEPCGCTSNPLGGIDRLAAQVGTLRDGKSPVVLLVAGDTFFDTSQLAPARVDQAKRNAKTLAAILDRLEVDAVLPGSTDRAQPPAFLRELSRGTGFAWLVMNGDSELLRISAGDLRLAVIGVREGTSSETLAAAVGTAQAETDLTIVLVDGSRRDANRVGAIDGVDFVVQGGLDEDAPAPPHRVGRAWALHAGRQGQGLTVVDLYRQKRGEPFVDRSEWSRRARVEQLARRIEDLASRIAGWEQAGDVNRADLDAQRARLAELERERQLLDAPAVEADSNSFFARWIELPKKAPRDEGVAKLMRKHDKAVNEANRVAFANLKPLPLGPDEVAYVGSEACSACHQQAYAWWRNHAHGLAYLTLQQRNKEYNLDCVSCHVTGYEQPGGSTVTHNLDGALVNVGCESCHGPGAAHTKNPEVPVVRDTPESTCVTCHNEEHSDLFDYEAYRKTLVVPGHGLPPLER